MTIHQLVNNWYYTNELANTNHKLYIKGNMDIKMYMESRKEAQETQHTLFTILKSEYGIENPYTQIPLNLDYVLNLVK